MTFNSVTFFVFLALAASLYWAVRPRRRNLVLLVASYIFYGWWDWRFLGLLALSTVVDFTVGRRMAESDDETIRKRLLLVSVVVNLTILGTFKYFGFFADSFTELFGWLGWEPDALTLDVILPVGISFYTFQTMSYAFDIYRRRIEPTDSLLDFGTYVAYFPQLVAGPIERAGHLLPQITTTDRQFPVGDQRREAIRLIIVGLAKKVVLADGVAGVANDAFGASADASWLALSAGVLAFSIQIYGDFSGYTDIARGVSKLLGIDLILNFTQPYLSRNITEFWRRWHISLSNWLRDYLYIPLGGNRGGRFNTYRNLMITMLLGGLWHGASWNFVMWGGLHGLYLIVHRVMRGARVADHEPLLREVPSILVSNFFVLLAWVFFRAADFGEAYNVITGIATFRSGPVNLWDVALVALFSAVMIASDLWERRRARTDLPAVRRLAPMTEGAVIGGLAAVILLFAGGTPVPFIYFQF